MQLQQLTAISFLCLGLIGAPALLAQGPSEPMQEAEQAEIVTVNINTADAPTLAESLDGVGLARARSIVDWRNANGPFEDPYDLVQINGISERIVALNEQRIRVTDKGASSGD